MRAGGFARSLCRGVLALFCTAALGGATGMRAQADAATPAAGAAAGQSEAGAAGTGEARPKRIGGTIAAPVVIYQVEPQYSEEARKARISGDVLVNLLLDETGMPTHVRVLRGVGMGLDEKAVEAVKQYKFKPAMTDGKPVAVELNVEIHFNSFRGKAAASPVPNSAGGPETAEQGAKGAPAPYESDPRFIAAMADAKKLSAARQLVYAIDGFKKANKIAGGKCAECLRQMVALQIKAGYYKDAAATAAELIAIADTTAEKSKAEALRGQALYEQAGEKPKPAQLQAADEMLKAAIADNPKSIAARFFEGTVLARMGQLDAAREQFAYCVSAASPNDPSYLRAKHFVENPAMSYAKMAPSFTVTALDGSKFTLDEMGGRVVLIDFWATWCGPCNEELPQMKKIARDFAGQPLVIISVSWDSDAAKWKEFLAKNEMTWVQYRDADHELSRRFGIDAIPHYFTIDSDGVLTAEILGSGNDVEGKLKKLVAKAKAAQGAAAVASATSPVADHAAGN